ncbi:DNA-binding response regulator [Enterococcus florum]|uniref:DNA-binding response regulator n=1 Tax=Enterococcus florum TaxID=2480627 RepID=A0A4P5PBN6_9ENTE|nr:LytTR family DNA-binding domain-containing protein [Enterococcus florum]GCF93884.1 DNA-binding response regulator [Enterococcus florum]
MIKVAICEDEAHFRKLIKEMLIKMSILLDFEIQTRSFTMAEELLSSMENGEATYDLLILDIELDGCDGMTAARDLRENYDYDGQLVFLTSHAELMQDSFEVGTNQYLVKPVEYPEFERKLSPILKNVLNNNRRLTVELVAGGFQILPLKDIITIQSKTLGRKGGVVIQTESEQVEAFGKMTNLYEKLEKYHFFRVHKQTIVNLEKIKTFDGEEITTTNRQTIKVSRNMKRQLKEKIMGIL